MLRGRGVVGGDKTQQLGKRCLVGEENRSRPRKNDIYNCLPRNAIVKRREEDDDQYEVS